jgi:hypothetical protein
MTDCSERRSEMSDTNEAHALRLLINEDEQALISLKKQETDILEHIAPNGFAAATTRERVISDAQIIEERLHKNKKQLAVLEQEFD